MHRGVLWGLALGIFMAALLVRVYPIEHYHGWDESSYLQHAERIAFGKSNYDEFAYRPPLLPILIAGAMVLWHTPVVASLLVALLSASVTIALFLLGRKVHSPEAGLAAALMAAVHPVLVRTGHLILTDAVAAAILAFALLAALDRRWWAALLAGLLAGAGAMTKFTGLAAVVILGCFMLWQDRVPPRRNTLLYAAGAAAVIGPYLAWAYVRYGSPLSTLMRAQGILPQAGPGPLFYFTLITLPMAAGLLLFIWRPRRSEFTALGLAWVLGIGGYLTLLEHKELRFALLALTPLFIFAGIGLSELLRLLRRHRRLAAAGIAILIIASSPSAFARLDEPPVNRWVPPPVDIAQHIVAQGTPDLPVYVTSDYPTYGYYTTNKIVVIDGPRFLEGYPRIMPREGYLVINKDRAVPPTTQWADARPELRRIAENDLVVLYKYR